MVVHTMYTYIVHVTDALGYVGSFKQARAFALGGPGHIARPREVIRALANKDLRLQLQSFGIYPSAEEYLHKRHGTIGYVVGHGLGLALGIQNFAFENTEKSKHGSVTFSTALYDGLLREALDINDLKDNQMPEGLNYAIKIIIPKNYKFISRDMPIDDVLRIKNSGKGKNPIIFESGSLTKQQFLLDDIALARCGSEASRERFAETICDVDLYNSIGNYHWLAEETPQTPIARPLLFFCNNGGLNMYNDFNDKKSLVMIVVEESTKYVNLSAPQNLPKIARRVIHNTAGKSILGADGDGIVLVN